MYMYVCMYEREREREREGEREGGREREKEREREGRRERKCIIIIIALTWALLLSLVYNSQFLSTNPVDCFKWHLCPYVFLFVLFE